MRTLLRSPGRIAAFAAVLILFILPPLWLLLSALKPQAEIFQWPPSLLPEHFTLENFEKTVSRANFGNYFINSAIVSITSALLSVTMSVMAGYALAKFRFKGDTVIFMIIMSAVMVPLQIVLIPAAASLNFSSAVWSPGLRSGWYLSASLRYALLMSASLASFATPSTS